MYLELKDGIQLYNEKNYKDALAFFLSSKSDKEDVTTEINYYTGLTYMRMQQYENALEFLEQVVTANTDIAKVYQCRLILAFIYASTDRTRLAEFELSKLVSAGYESAQVFASTAYISYEHNDVKKAVDFYERALAADPENSTALNGLGYVLAETGGDLDKALELCKKAVEKRPWNPAYLDSLAMVYHKLDFQDDAENYIQKAKEKDPENTVILNHFQMIMDKEPL